MGERQKETLSPNNYFDGKGGEGRVVEGTIEIKTFSLASYVLIASPVSLVIIRSTSTAVFPDPAAADTRISFSLSSIT